MEIKVLGPGCAKCKSLFAATAKAAAEIGVGDMDLQKIEKIDEIASYGVMITPALIIDGVLKVQGKVPDHRQLMEWLREAGQGEQAATDPANSGLSDRSAVQIEP
ncbi:MAG: thioredoxin family protein [Deltaproteobacteria bacterium]|nr:thioredoxin family protein [Deltaproteobacteria bacterium]